MHERGCQGWVKQRGKKVKRFAERVGLVRVLNSLVVAAMITQ